MQDIVALHRIKYDGKTYPPGHGLAVGRTEAEALVQAGAAILAAAEGGQPDADIEEEAKAVEPPLGDLIRLTGGTMDAPLDAAPAVVEKPKPKRKPAAKGKE